MFVRHRTDLSRNRTEARERKRLKLDGDILSDADKADVLVEHLYFNLDPALRRNHDHKRFRRFAPLQSCAPPIAEWCHRRVR